MEKKELAWLGGSDRDDYLFAANIAQQYAKLNRKAMMDSLLHYLGFDFAYTERVESVHNYIDFTDTVSMIRKGAISAKKGERVIIPMNMAYGCVLGTGLGKALWNNSAPHGAGRAMSRSVAKKSITLDEFKAVMTDVWSSCVQQSTIDEAPQAYKQVDDVLDYLSETVTLDTKIKSVYNFKST